MFAGVAIFEDLKKTKHFAVFFILIKIRRGHKEPFFVSQPRPLPLFLIC